ncbi:MAG: YbaK/EbsC family protein [Alphaproteobacteria bacterium]|nr:YbaK/EbsC family protein [Alphaproteobacteria bacterium]
MSDGKLPSSAQRVQDALAEKGFANRVVVMPATTRTAAEAASACGCSVAQIAKSLIFRAKSSDRPVLVITSGANRVNEKRVAEALGEKLGRADADFVRERTGFAIGGVAPIGHGGPVVVFIDRDLMAFDEIWAAAGTPSAVFKLTPDDLVAMTGGAIIDIT